MVYGHIITGWKPDIEYSVTCDVRNSKKHTAHHMDTHNQAQYWQEGTANSTDANTLTSVAPLHRGDCG